MKTLYLRFDNFAEAINVPDETTIEALSTLAFRAIGGDPLGNTRATITHPVLYSANQISERGDIKRSMFDVDDDFVPPDGAIIEFKKKEAGKH